VPEAADPTSLAEQEKHEQAWRHMLVQSVLAVLLPTEDLQNGPLRSLVEEIVAEMIVGNIISNRLCEPWALWDLIANSIQAVQGNSGGPQSDATQISKRYEPSRDSAAPVQSSIRRLAQFGLLSGSPNSSEAQTTTVKRSQAAAISNVFWMAMSYGLVLFTAGRAVLVILMTWDKLPLRASTKIEGSERSGPPAPPRPILSMGMWNASANIIQLPKRMPWLSGLMSLAQQTVVSGPGRMGATDGMLDR
jgi:hypothetical protein